MFKPVSGSERFDSNADVLHFRVTFDGQPVSCAISREALENLLGEELGPRDADEQFLRVLDDVMRLVHRKFENTGLNAHGALAVSARDVFEGRMN